MPQVCFTAPYNTTLFFKGHPDCGMFIDNECTGCPDAIGITIEASILERCIPDPTAETGAFNAVIGDQINSFVSYSNAESYIGDMVQSFAGCLMECFYCMIIALILSYFVIILMRYVSTTRAVPARVLTATSPALDRPTPAVDQPLPTATDRRRLQQSPWCLLPFPRL